MSLLHVPVGASTPAAQHGHSRRTHNGLQQRKWAAGSDCCAGWPPSGAEEAVGHAKGPLQLRLCGPSFVAAACIHVHVCWGAASCAFMGWLGVEVHGNQPFKAYRSRLLPLLLVSACCAATSKHKGLRATGKPCPAACRLGFTRRVRFVL